MWIPLVIDVEATTILKGNPFVKENRLELVGLYDSSSYSIIDSDFDKISIPHNTLLIGFNIKFDLHWLRRAGVKFNNPVWDCQLAEFLISNQSNSYPSLDGTAQKYGLGKKLEIDFNNATLEEKKVYNQQDLNLTYHLYLKQKEILQQNKKRYNLFRLQCQDLLVLEEMEWNGQLFDVEKAFYLEKQTEEEIDVLTKEVCNTYCKGIPINLNSTNHLSCLLYGGILKHTYRVPSGAYWKSGKRAGEIRYTTIEQEFELPRLVDPLKGSELQKEGYWSTDEPTLRMLPKTKKVGTLIDLLLKLSDLEKLRGTYYKGIPNTIEYLGNNDNLIHGNFNQCVVITGRLSSTNPNQQNFAGEVKELLISRWP